MDIKVTMIDSINNQGVAKPTYEIKSNGDISFDKALNNITSELLDKIKTDIDKITDIGALNINKHLSTNEVDENLLSLLNYNFQNNINLDINNIKVDDNFVSKVSQVELVDLKANQFILNNSSITQEEVQFNDIELINVLEAIEFEKELSQININLDGIQEIEKLDIIDSKLKSKSMIDNNELNNLDKDVVFSNSIQKLYEVEKSSLRVSNESINQLSVIDQLKEQLVISKDLTKTTYTISLLPKTLGEVKVEVSFDDNNNVIVRFDTLNENAKELLSSNVNEIKSIVTEHNLSVNEVEVYISSDLTDSHSKNNGKEERNLFISENIERDNKKIIEEPSKVIDNQILSKVI